MKIQRKPIKIGDINTNEITIENSYKMKVSFLSYCGIITSIEVPDSNGEFGNIVLNPQENLDYLNSFNYGNIITLISDKPLLLDKKYYLNIDDLEILGLDNFVEYEFEMYEEKNYSSICVNLNAEIIDEYGYKLNKTIKYSLDEENNFLISYEIISQKDILLNIFNNLNFNLSIEKRQNVLEHKVCMPVKYFYKMYEKDSKIRKFSVENNAFDFSTLKSLNEGIYNYRYADNVDSILFELNNEDIIPTISIYDEKSKRLINITTDNTHIFMSSNNNENIEIKDKKKSITLRFYNFILDKKSMDLDFPIIESGKSYKKFINYNFKLM